jgi:hypothetical protein
LGIKLRSTPRATSSRQLCSNFLDYVASYCWSLLGCGFKCLYRSIKIFFRSNACEKFFGRFKGHLKAHCLCQLVLSLGWKLAIQTETYLCAYQFRVNSQLRSECLMNFVDRAGFHFVRNELWRSIAAFFQILYQVAFSRSAECLSSYSVLIDFQEALRIEFFKSGLECRLGDLPLGTEA